MSKAAELAALIGSQTALSHRNLITNGAMQIWLELGLPGALLVAMLAALTGYRAITLRERHDAAMAAGLVTTAVLIWLLSFGVWQSWWMSTFVLAFLLAVPSRRFNKGGNSERASS